MSIAFDRYVDITSGLGSPVAARERDLIARFISTNSLLPTGGVEEFSSLESVAAYFGTNNDEYRRAQFYFGFVSKAITSPERISYARWADTDTAPTVIGIPITATLAQFTAITTGNVEVTLGTTTQDVTAINLSSATSFTDVASALQVAIRASIIDNQFDTATVVYDAVNEWFILTGGVAEAAAVAIGDSALATLLGWTAQARFSPGVLTETVTEVLSNSTQLNNNFGSFAFVPTLTQPQVIEAVTWNDGNNVLFQFHTPVLAADATALSTAVINLGGTGITLKDATPNEFPEVLPMAVLGATDYTRRAAVQNYMFQQAGLTPTVITAADADLYDPLRVNYYGQTQTAGQNLSFYQRGFLTGTGTDPINMNVFANEQWLKDAAGVALINLLLAIRVPANNTGRASALAVLRGVVDRALINGTISVGRTLTAQDRIFIAQQSGDPNAFQQVQTSGYWLDAQIVVDGTEQIIQYTLIYAKDDVIRKVDGSHQLI